MPTTETPTRTLYLHTSIWGRRKKDWGDAFAYLYDPDTKRQCCLGVILTTLYDLKKEDIECVAMPDELDDVIKSKLPEWLTGSPYNSPGELARNLAGFNDATNLSTKKKAARIRKALKPVGIDLVLVEDENNEQNQ